MPCNQQDLVCNTVYETCKRRLGLPRAVLAPLVRCSMLIIKWNPCSLQMMAFVSGVKKHTGPEQFLTFRNGILQDTGIAVDPEAIDAAMDCAAKFAWIGELSEQ